MAVSKDQLKPGMTLKSTRSRLLGTVRAETDKPDELYFCADHCVWVTLGPQEGRRAKDTRHTIWALTNVEIVE